jgi:hypothetical protein
MAKKYYLILGMALLSLLVQTTFAQTNNDTSNEGFYIEAANPNAISPLSFMYEIKPGEKITDGFILVNSGNAARKFHIYTADSFKENDKVYFNEDKDPKNFAKWVTLPISEIELQPGEKQTFTMEINVPQDTKEGTYLLGFAMSFTKPSNNSNITITPRLIRNIRIKVTNNPQPVPKLGETNIFNTALTYSWGVVIFLGAMGYFFYANRKEKKAKVARAAVSTDNNQTK